MPPSKSDQAPLKETILAAQIAILQAEKLKLEEENATLRAENKALQEEVSRLKAPRRNAPTFDPVGWK